MNYQNLILLCDNTEQWLSCGDYHNFSYFFFLILIGNVKTLNSKSISKVVVASSVLKLCELFFPRGSVAA